MTAISTVDIKKWIEDYERRLQIFYSVSRESEDDAINGKTNETWEETFGSYETELGERRSLHGVRGEKELGC